MPVVHSISSAVRFFARLFWLLHNEKLGLIGRIKKSIQGGIYLNSFLDSSNKPSDWPANNREAILENIYYAAEEFKNNPGCKAKELLLSLISEHDLNQRSHIGLHRVTDFEVQLINILYLMGAAYQINALKIYLYELLETQRVCIR